MRAYSRRVAVVGIGAVAAFPLVRAVRARAADERPITLAFVPYAVFFSEETHQRAPIDPQVFVRDPNVKGGVGPQGIRHLTDLQPAPLSDPGDTPLFNAGGRPLGFTLAEWLAARGQVVITPLPSGGATVAVQFTGLRPQGVYSLFENHVDQHPVGVTPLDGKGKHNSFTAGPEGAASLTVTAPKMLTSANAVLLVYHSDGKARGQSRGVIGVAAHHQLIAKMP